MTAVQQPLAPEQRDLIRDELLRSLTKLERSITANGARAIDTDFHAVILSENGRQPRCRRT